LSLLLDTHTLFWWVTDSALLSEQARRQIADEAGDCYVSAVSVFELSNKVRLGKFDPARELVERLQEVMEYNRFTPLAVSMDHARLAGRLANPHRDPFDRLLAAQSIIENIPVVTADTAIRDLGARVVW
jgi:PIN domain nuclease of toxin-antitoxin system